MTDVTIPETQDPVVIWEEMTLDDRLSIIKDHFTEGNVEVEASDFVRSLNETIKFFASQTLIDQKKVMNSLLDVYNFLKSHSGSVELVEDFMRNITYLNIVRGEDAASYLRILASNIESN